MAKLPPGSKAGKLGYANKIRASGAAKVLFSRLQAAQPAAPGVGVAPSIGPPPGKVISDPVLPGAMPMAAPSLRPVPGANLQPVDDHGAGIMGDEAGAPKIRKPGGSRYM